MTNYSKQFQKACKNGEIATAKWLIQEHQVNVHACNVWTFIRACSRGHIETVG